MSWGDSSNLIGHSLRAGSPGNPVGVFFQSSLVCRVGPECSCFLTGLGFPGELGILWSCGLAFLGNVTLYFFGEIVAVVIHLRQLI